MDRCRYSCWHRSGGHVVGLPGQAEVGDGAKLHLWPLSSERPEGITRSIISIITGIMSDFEVELIVRENEELEDPSGADS